MVPQPTPWFYKYRWLLFGADTAMAVAAAFGTFLPLYDLTNAEIHKVGYGTVAALLVVAWALVLEAVESRSRLVVGSGLAEFRRVIAGSLYLFGGVAAASFALHAELARSMFLTTMPLGVVLLLLGRWVCRIGLKWVRRSGGAMTPALLVGSGAMAASVVRDLRRFTEAGYLAAGVCAVDAVQNESDLDELTKLPQVKLDDVVSSPATHGYHAVIVLDGLDTTQIRDLAWGMENSPVDLLFLPRLADVAGPRMTVSSLEGLSLVHVELPEFTGAKPALKRAFDIAFSATVLLLLAPVFVVIALAIRLDDRGPVFFRQERVGRGGIPFTIHKFRTMSVDAEAKIDTLIAANGGSALLFKLADDPRVTRVGSFLRKHSLDELPQFWTVLRGPMSVVGPRPQVAREVAEYTPRHHRRLLIKPGITGLWQVYGRNDLSPEDAIRLDLRYVENWSLTGDFTIILRTVGVVLRTSGAY